jgi:hypothetical protein
LLQTAPKVQDFVKAHNQKLKPEGIISNVYSTTYKQAEKIVIQGVEPEQIKVIYEADGRLRGYYIYPKVATLIKLTDSAGTQNKKTYPGKPAITFFFGIKYRLEVIGTGVQITRS